MVAGNSHAQSREPPGQDILHPTVAAIDKLANLTD
jgi:hypothetical protein